VLAEEVLGIAAPTLDVNGAPEHNRVIALNAVDLSGLDAVDAQAGLP